MCACQKEVTSVPTLPDTNKSLNKIGEISVAELRSYWDNDQANRFITSDVSVYRAEYTSNINGESIPLSGAVLIPETEEIKGIISIQHATFFADIEAPSENGAFSVVSRKGIFSSNGYIVVLPDYLGYGVDKDRIHPYHQASTLASASYEMITAAKDLMSSLILQVIKCF